jgi:hypothetical protein
MHPDLYYVVHQQRERELLAALRYRTAARERGVPVRTHRRRTWSAIAELVTGACDRLIDARVQQRHRGASIACCAAA